MYCTNLLSVHANVACSGHGAVLLGFWSIADRYIHQGLSYFFYLSTCFLLSACLMLSAQYFLVPTKLEGPVLNSHIGAAATPTVMYYIDSGDLTLYCNSCMHDNRASQLDKYLFLLL